MELIGFVILVLGLTIAGFAMKKSVLAIGAAGAWIVLAFYSLGVSTSPNPTEITDVYMALFWFGCFLAITCIFESVYMRSKKEMVEDGLISESEALERDFAEIDEDTKLPRLGGRRKKKSGIRRALGRI